MQNLLLPRHMCCVTASASKMKALGIFFKRDLFSHSSFPWVSSVFSCLHLTRRKSEFYKTNYISIPSFISRMRGFHTCSSHFSDSEDVKKYQKYKPPFLQAEQYLDKIAIIDYNGAFSYGDIMHHSMVLNANILQILNAGKSNKVNGQRIALLTEQDVSYVIGQFATWMAEGISVPLCVSHPVSEWQYFLEDSQCSLLLVAERFAGQITPVAKELGIAVKVLPKIDHGLADLKHTDNQWFLSSNTNQSKTLKEPGNNRIKKRWFDHEDELILKSKPALIIYTSGTTGRPKGVVLTHDNLSTMVSGMIESWAWSAQDVILHVLPLHHIHGIVNVLLTPLTCGATCIMERKFDAERTWDLLTSQSISVLGKGINVFMAVPTVYAKMIQYYEEKSKGQEEEKTTGSIRSTLEKNIRLMVSGSAALPQPVSDRWLEVTGHRLLERYGMTEIGMALTNPLHGERIVGAVGNPFPNVNVRIVQPNDDAPLGFDILAEGNDKLTTVTQGCEDIMGELQVKGPNVFSQYWNKPEATAETFTDEGWFKTGDTAIYQDGVYRIVGRTSVDILKSGGYKISALDVERHLLAHPDIIDVAVIGLTDVTWGQKVAAVVITKDGKPLDLKDLRHWAKEVLPPYQTPTILKCLPTIPRNAMGKVNKKELAAQVFPDIQE